MCCVRSSNLLVQCRHSVDKEFLSFTDKSREIVRERNKNNDVSIKNDKSSQCMLCVQSWVGKRSKSQCSWTASHSDDNYQGSESAKAEIGKLSRFICDNWLWQKWSNPFIKNLILYVYLTTTKDTFWSWRVKKRRKHCFFSDVDMWLVFSGRAIYWMRSWWAWAGANRRLKPSPSYMWTLQLFIYFHFNLNSRVLDKSFQRSTSR